MGRQQARPAIEVVELAYVDHATGEPREEPTLGERIELGERMMTKIAEAVFGPGVRARHRNPCQRTADVTLQRQ